MKTKTKNLILVIIVVIVASFLPALIFGKWFEAIIFLLCHTLIRPQFKRQYHHIVPEICREITGAVAFFGICFTLPIEISLLSAIPINYIIAWVGHIKASSDYYEIKCIKLKEKYCTEKIDIETKCRNANLGERDTIIALMYYYEHKKPKEIWLWLCQQNKYEQIEWDSLYIILWRIGKKLNKKLKKD